MTDPDATLTLDAIGSQGATEAETLLVGRYRLGDVLGRGASGVVVAADDVLTGDRVAVKLGPVLSSGARRQLRRELTALLALRLPGVVRLRDEGTLGDRSVVVGQPLGHRIEHSVRVSERASRGLGRDSHRELHHPDEQRTSGTECGKLCLARVGPHEVERASPILEDERVDPPACVRPETAIGDSTVALSAMV